MRKNAKCYLLTLEALLLLAALELLLILSTRARRHLVQRDERGEHKNATIIYAINMYCEPICKRFWEDKQQRDEEERKQVDKPIAQKKKRKFTNHTEEWMYGEKGGEIDGFGYA